MTTPFVHLRLQSEYALGSSIARIKDVVRQCEKAGVPALGLTDPGHLFAAVKFQQQATAAGVQPIIGAEVTVQFPHGQAAVALLCQNADGYRNLVEIVSEANTQQPGNPRVIPAANLLSRHEGLICLLGQMDGPVWLAEEVGVGQGWLDPWLEAFGDRLYLEVRRLGREYDNACNNVTLQLGANRKIPVVATNPVCFLRREDYEAQQARAAISESISLADPRRTVRETEFQYFRSAGEMAELFSDLPEALANSVNIAKRCGFLLSFGDYQLPPFPTPHGESEDEFMAKTAREGLDERLDFHEIPEEQHDEYRARLDHEVQVIQSMGFSGYFLIVADFIKWARNNGVPVGPGRGSGAGSIVAWALRITDLDPIPYGLLFERFLNPERVSMPDFDVDFCIQGRDRVISYVKERYGADRVTQIVTFGTMAAKAAVRDAARVLGFPYAVGAKLAGAVPDTLGVSLQDAEREPEMQKLLADDGDAASAFELAKQLEGLPRNIGTHAGGVIIAGGPLSETAPVIDTDDGTRLVQYDMIDAEKIGLVKFDFLGLKTLTIIDNAIRLANEKRRAAGDEELVADAIPLYDRAAFEALQRGEATGVFQLESAGMRKLMMRLKPESFEDLTALVALYRPGPLQSGMVEDFVDRKHGRAETNYPHPDLEDVLRPTYGVFLYQEQVMQTAQILAGYSLGEADLLRRAMGKKKPAEMAKQREIFIAGATDRGVDAAKAGSIFDLMEKFAGYGFNKSHSAAYALVAWRTAWLKVHYPQEFLSAVMSADMDNTEKLGEFVGEARRLGLEVLAPDVQHSHFDFRPEGSRGIRFGLGAVKGVGAAVLQPLIDERSKGVYSTFYDVVDRCSAVLSKRTVEGLVKAGAFDSFGIERATLSAWTGACVQSAQQSAANAATGQNDMFGGGAALSAPPQPKVEPWARREQLDLEREHLGLYLTGHPVDDYRDDIEALSFCRLAEAETVMAARLGAAGDQRSIRIGGWVTRAEVINTNGGRRMAIIVLDDGTGSVEVIAYNDVCESQESLIQPDRVLFVDGRIEMDERTERVKLVAERLLSLGLARAQRTKYLRISLPANRQTDDEYKRRLMSVLKERCGGPTEVVVGYLGSNDAPVSLGEKFRVLPSDETLQALRDAADGSEVSLEIRGQH